jgi:hypothetical protein
MSDATIIPFRQPAHSDEAGDVQCCCSLCQPATDLREYLAGFIGRFPFEPLAGCDFERGYLAGLITAYQAAGFDRNDARYLAGLRMLKRMSS